MESNPYRSPKFGGEVRSKKSENDLGEPNPRNATIGLYLTLVYPIALALVYISLTLGMPHNFLDTNPSLGLGVHLLSLFGIAGVAIAARSLILDGGSYHANLAVFFGLFNGIGWVVLLLAAMI